VGYALGDFPPEGPPPQGGQLRPEEGVGLGYRPREVAGWQRAVHRRTIPRSGHRSHEGVSGLGLRPGTVVAHDRVHVALGELPSTGHVHYRWLHQGQGTNASRNVEGELQGYVRPRGVADHMRALYP
jgi:hypothetical protein